jgi:glutaredoxin
MIDLDKKYTDYIRKHRVAVYGSEYCHACTQVQLFLEEHNIPYDYFKVGETISVSDFVSYFNIKSVPLVLIDGEQIIGFDKDRMTRLLNL